MPTQKKIDTVADLKERIERATLLATAEYRGLRVKEMVEMRRRLREAGIEMKVIKNSLLKLAAKEAGQPELLSIIEGPTALALSYGDVIEAAKALAGYAQGAPSAFALRGGFMDGSVLSAQDLRELVRVPPRAGTARAVHGPDAVPSRRLRRPTRRTAPRALRAHAGLAQ